ncbi:tRNA dihydrouridine synthase DusB [Catenibacillus scindens]|uniref:tRNA dihydrouridine synthase DusB n=1 Tax=Catenibacillus scindens TaxID=673271 RepID=UPI0032088C3B
MDKVLLKPVSVGGVTVDFPVTLAPMAGVSDQPFRRICKAQGCGLLCTEMVSAKALYYNNKNTFPLMAIESDEHPIALQIFGSEPELMGEMAAKIEALPFDILDINMGCPVPKVVNNGEGSALMKDPLLAGRIIESIVRSIKKPVTVKFRKGFDMSNVNAVEMAHVAQESGASAVAVHGRTRSQYYSGKADWDIIRQVKQAVSIPVFGNGDIVSPKDAQAMVEQTGCDGIMIGRGAQGNPWIFSGIRHYFNTGEILPKPSVEEVAAMILKHSRMEIQFKGEFHGIREMRKHIGWYTAGYPDSARLRRQANQVETLDELKRLLDEYIVDRENSIRYNT